MYISEVAQSEQWLGHRLQTDNWHLVHGEDGFSACHHSHFGSAVHSASCPVVTLLMALKGIMLNICLHLVPKEKITLLSNQGG